MQKSIYKKIIKFRNGDNNSLEEIIELFNPVINKYSRLLDGEDTRQDLIIHIIKVLNKIPIDKIKFYQDKAILGYIVKAVRNQYIYLSKKNSKKNLNETSLNFEWEIGYDEFESELELLDLFEILTEKESFIIKSIYVYYLSISEIADYMNISRQAVNQSKNRALKKLEKLYLEL